MKDESGKSRFALTQIAAIGVFSAIVFVMNYLQIPVPLATGNTRIHLGNAMCLLAGFVLGPVGGGLAAGIGSELYDLLLGDFIFIPFYFVFKFLMAFAGAGFARLLEKESVRPTTAYVAGASVGQLLYLVLHLCCMAFFFDAYLNHLPVETVVVNLVSRLLSSGFNAVIAVIGSTLLGGLLVPVYQKIRR